MDEDVMRNLLRKACEAAGNQAIWAAQNGVRKGYVSDVLNGRRSPIDLSVPGRKLLDALGLEVALRRKRLPL